MNGLNTKARAPRRTIELTVEKANDGGILAQGVWHNYGRIFKGKKLSHEAVGDRVELTEAYSENDKKWFVVDLRMLEDELSDANATAAEEEIQEAPAEAESAPEIPAPAPERAASPEALQFAEDLALKTGVSSENLDAGCRLLWKKAFNEIPPRVASCLIEAFGGYKRSGGSQRPERS